MAEERVETPEGAAGGSSSPDDPELNYKAPAEKSIGEILEADADDEAMRKYKETLLGNASGGEAIVVEPDNPNNVIVKRLSLLVDGRDPMVLDLSGDLSTIKKTVFSIKEGVHFKIKIEFFVQREIVAGLKYVQKTTRMGVTVDKMNLMVGSYAPKAEMHSYTTPGEDAPEGRMGRGTYHVNSLFTDDDKKEYLKWEWNMKIEKDWS